MSSVFIGCIYSPAHFFQKWYYGGKCQNAEIIGYILQYALQTIRVLTSIPMLNQSESPPASTSSTPPPPFLFIAFLLIGFTYIRRFTYWSVSQRRLMRSPSGRAGASPKDLSHILSGRRRVEGRACCEEEEEEGLFQQGFLFRRSN